MAQTTNMDFKPLRINPDRFCEGISKIGYKPAAAIMDIVDNAIAAGATRVEIEIVTRAGTTINTSGNVEVVRIYDNGHGMSSTGVDVALEIGSTVSYAPDSLSKFGLGLKSAGFSLGRRIEVSSKAVDDMISSKFVDRDIIKDLNQYGVCGQAVPAAATTWFEKHEHGTLIEILKTSRKQDSAGKIRKELRKRLGVTYYEFLSKDNHPLTIGLRVADEFEEVQPLDILFWDVAAEEFDPDDYDGRIPCKVFDADIDVDPLTPDAPVRLQVSIFPMDKMKSYAPFSEDEKNRIAGYQITRENNGFFFYRNGRLIVWGDKIAGVRRDDIGFRARISFATASDESLHVDVSKQRLELNEDFLDRLAVLCQAPLSDARLAFNLCKKMLRLGTGGEGDAFNERTDIIEETDPDEDVAPTAPEKKIERRSHLEAETRATESEEVAEAEKISTDEAAVFRRIRYSDKIIGLDLAVPGTDRNEGTYVRINQNHTFYDLVMKELDPAEPSRLAIEAVLWAAAVAETKTTENFTDVPYDTLRQVFSRFRRVFCQMLDAWAIKNYDLFE